MNFFKSSLKALLLILLVSSRCAFAQVNNFKIENLRCEYAVNPIGIDQQHPRLSWNISTGRRNWKQQAYRIVVSSTEAKCNNKIGDMWDSNTIISDATTQIEYKGLPLASTTLYYWRVQVTEAISGRKEWSNPAFFETAMLNQNDWKARWIGRGDTSIDEPDNSLFGCDWIWAEKTTTGSVQFVKSFNVKSTTLIDSAYLLYTADKNAVAFLNNKEVTIRTSVKNEWQILKYKLITSQLNSGLNTLKFTAMPDVKTHGLVCRLMIRYKDGETQIIKSDDTWNVESEGITGKVKVIVPFGDHKPWYTTLLHPAKALPAPYLRKEFSAIGTIKAARIYVAAPGFAEIRLNGRKVGGERERDPGFTRFDKTVLYSTYDVTDLVKNGINALGAILGTGWYDVHDQAVWYLDSAPWRARPTIKLQMLITYTDGHMQTLNTDETWKVSDGPIITDGIYTGEVYDARKELKGWDMPGYNITGWASCKTMHGPTGKLAGLSCPPVSVGRIITPIAITEPKKGVYIVDMGENFSGHAQLNIAAPRGTQITMRYAEHLDDKGMIERANIESFMAPTDPKQLFQTDRYICKGSGMETWEQRFSYNGFRYIEVTGLPFKPELSNFKGRFAYTLFEKDGNFECSNPLINNIQKIILQSYLSNAQNIPTDCPQREKNGWTADAHLAADLGIMNYNAATFYSKWLDDIADSQLSSGLIPVIVPSANWGLHWEPEWTSAYHLIVWDLYQYYGDKKVIAKHYDRLKLYTDSLVKQRKNGLLPGYSYGDWAPYDTKTSTQLTSNAYLYLEAEIISKLADVLGKKDDAFRYHELAKEVDNNFNKKFLSDASYDNGSQCALSTPLYFNMVPPDKAIAVFKTLINKVDSTGHIDAGILGTKHLLRTLSDHNRTDLAYQLVNTVKNPGWGYFVGQGATSLWGGWGRAGKKNNGSLNHIMFGDVSAWFYRDLAGIQADPLRPGFKHIIIKPGIVGDLKWVKAQYRSVEGMIDVNWTKNESSTTLDLSLPANTTGSVYLPAMSVDQISENGVLLKNISSVKYQLQSTGLIEINVGSGHYQFVVRK